MKKAIGLVVLVLASSAVHAKVVTTEDNTAQKVKGLYLGAGVGTTEFDSLDEDLYDAGSDGSSVKFMAGYQFNRVFALEGQYTKYGEITESRSDYTWSPKAISLSANLGYTFLNGLRPFGIIGLSSIDIGESKTNPNTDTSFSVHYGFGLEYAPIVLRGFSARAGYELDFFVINNDDYYYDSKSYTLGSLYASIAYKF